MKILAASLPPVAASVAENCIETELAGDYRLSISGSDDPATLARLMLG